MSTSPASSVTTNGALRALAHAVGVAISDGISKVELNGDVLTVFDSTELDVCHSHVSKQNVVAKFRVTLTPIDEG
jgi:hypothetical protein